MAGGRALGDEMTVIAVRDGTMAADSRGVSNNIVRHIQKIFKTGNCIIGISGYADDCSRLMNWYLAGCKGLPDYRMIKDDDPDACLLVMLGGGPVQRVNRSGFTEDVMPSARGFFAIGSGAVAAMAAMEMGATAEKAVEIACRIDPDCGGQIQVERLK